MDKSLEYDLFSILVHSSLTSSILSISSLLTSLSYDHRADVLIHTGDILAKGPHDGSMNVLAYMMSYNVTGVRGNHDQKVIEWRTWLEWIRSLKGGNQWLQEIRDKWIEDEDEGMDLELWLMQERRTSKKKWWKHVPDKWTLFDDHYQIANAMSPQEYEYLLSLPLKLHAPSAHTFIAHAGLLPSDPHFKPYHRQQPLAHVPVLPTYFHQTNGSENSTLSLLRLMQEVALLTDVPQNTDPWVVLNMRSVTADHEVSR